VVVAVLAEEVLGVGVPDLLFGGREQHEAASLARHLGRGSPAALGEERGDGVHDPPI
jgi:hypothetical protein